MRSINKINSFSDHDQCSDNSHECSVNGVCNNTEGSYECDCSIGFIGRICTGMGVFVKNLMLFFIINKSF